VVTEDYIKPHGRLLFDRRVVCWGLAKDWKAVLLAAYERAYRNLGKPYAAVLLRGVGKMAQPSERRMVEDLAGRLGIEKVVWLEASAGKILFCEIPLGVYLEAKVFVTVKHDCKQHHEHE
jgi:hypothetical protein